MIRYHWNMFYVRFQYLEPNMRIRKNTIYELLILEPLNIKENNSGMESNMKTVVPNKITK